MATATVSRGGTSIDIPLVSNSGDVLVATDVGKPEQDIRGTGTLNPIPDDRWSVNEQYTLLGMFTSSSAYSDAIDLANLIKSNSGDPPSPLLLNINMPEFDTDIKVAPAAGQGEALTLTYNPGRKDWVLIDLSLTRVSIYEAGFDQSATTPTTAGTGPISIDYRGDSVDIIEDVTVVRSIGRPESVVRRRPDKQYPSYYDKHKTAVDRFEISTRFSDSNYLTDMGNLSDIFSTKLGRNTLDLSFGGMYDMGTFNVVPDGSGALRHQRRAGEEGTKLLPQISLRRVRDLG